MTALNKKRIYPRCSVKDCTYLGYENPPPEVTPQRLIRLKTVALQEVVRFWSQDAMIGAEDLVNHTMQRMLAKEHLQKPGLSPKHQSNIDHRNARWAMREVLGLTATKVKQGVQKDDEKEINGHKPEIVYLEDLRRQREGRSEEWYDTLDDHEPLDRVERVVEMRLLFNQFLVGINRFDAERKVVFHYLLGIGTAILTTKAIAPHLHKRYTRVQAMIAEGILLLRKHSAIPDPGADQTVSTEQLLQYWLLLVDHSKVAVPWEAVS